jgi:cytochrome c biogenesis protein CcdA
MVGTILPMVHEERSDNRHELSVWLHALGCVIGSICMGTLLGAGGALIPWSLIGHSQQIVIPLVTGLVSLAYGARELDLLRIPCPQLHRQVPAGWRYRLPRRAVATLYGVVLGFGFATRIPVSTLYAAATWAFLRGDPVLAALIMIPFGIGRAVPLILISRSQAAYSETFQINQFIRVWKPVVNLANGVILGFLGAYLFASGIMH